MSGEVEPGARGLKILRVHLGSVSDRVLQQCLTFVLSRHDALRDAKLSELVFGEPALESRMTSDLCESGGVAILDAKLPARRAVEMSRFVRRFLKSHAIILLEQVPRSEEGAALLLDCLEAGASGFLLSETALDDFPVALSTVQDGHVFCSPALTGPLLEQLAHWSREAHHESRRPKSKLTTRELEILEAIAEGLSNKEVAKKLELSLFTVKNHVHKILTKLQAIDRADAVNRAVEIECLTFPVRRVSSSLRG